jgi:hypothetical protein
MVFVCVFQVKQREEETQCSKMILRFREDKIQRLETLSDGNLTTDTYLVEEKNAALKELQLMRDGKGCNPEVTRFAMENMRLQEQLRKYDVVHVSHLVYDLILLLVARHITKACCVSLSTASACPLMLE